MPAFYPAVTFYVQFEPFQRIFKVACSPSLPSSRHPPPRITLSHFFNFFARM